MLGQYVTTEEVTKIQLLEARCSGAIRASQRADDKTLLNCRAHRAMLARDLSGFDAELARNTASVQVASVPVAPYCRKLPKPVPAPVHQHQSPFQPQPHRHPTARTFAPPLPTLPITSPRTCTINHYPTTTYKNSPRPNSKPARKVLAQNSPPPPARQKTNPSRGAVLQPMGASVTRRQRTQW